jgi:hypothetical protein
MDAPKNGKFSVDRLWCTPANPCQHLAWDDIAFA